MFWIWLIAIIVLAFLNSTKRKSDWQVKKERKTRIRQMMYNKRNSGNWNYGMRL